MSGTLDGLNDDVLVHALSYLPTEDLVYTVVYVCKRLNRLCEDPLLWASTVVDVGSNAMLMHLARKHHTIRAVIQPDNRCSGQLHQTLADALPQLTHIYNFCIRGVDTLEHKLAPLFADCNGVVNYADPARLQYVLNCDNLTSLTVRNGGVPNMWRAFTSICPHLLHLDTDQIDMPDLAALPESAPQLLSLGVIVRECDDPAVDLSAFWDAHTNLRKVNTRVSLLATSDVAAVGPSPRGLTHFHARNETDFDERCVCNSASTLVELRVSDLTEAMMLAFVEAANDLPSKKLPLRSLEFGFVDFTLKDLISAFARTLQLASLTIIENNCGVAARFVDSLAYYTRLKLGGSLDELLRLLDSDRLKNIVEVSDRITLSHSSCIALGRHAHHLTELTICGQAMTTESFKALAPACSHLRKLTLTVSCCAGALLTSTAAHTLNELYAQYKDTDDAVVGLLQSSEPRVIDVIYVYSLGERAVAALLAFAEAGGSVRWLVGTPVKSDVGTEELRARVALGRTDADIAKARENDKEKDAFREGFMAGPPELDEPPDCSQS